VELVAEERAGTASTDPRSLEAFGVEACDEPKLPGQKKERTTANAARARITDIRHFPKLPSKRPVYKPLPFSGRKTNTSLSVDWRCYNQVSFSDLLRRAKLAEEKPKAELDDFYASIVLKELQPDEKLLFARLEDPMPRILKMSKMLLAFVLVVLIFEIYVKHHSPPTLQNVILFVMTWLAFMLLFKKVYKCVDAISTKRFLRVRPGISVHYGWLRDVDKIVLGKTKGEEQDLEIFLNESGKYEARNLKRPEMKARAHHGIKRIVIANLQAAQKIKAMIEEAAASSK